MDLQRSADQALFAAHLGTQDWAASAARLWVLAERSMLWREQVVRTKVLEHGWSLAIATSIGTAAAPERRLFEAGERRLEELAEAAALAEWARSAKGEGEDSEQR